MWGRKLKAENARLKAQMAGNGARIRAAEADADQSRQVAQFEIRKRAEAEADAQAGVRRVNDRVRALREDLETATERYRVAEKRIRVLEQQLDDATGLDDPRVAAGAGWRDRFLQQPTPTVRGAATPSGVLPRREPGLPEQGAAS